MTKDIKYFVTSSVTKYNDARSYAIDSLICNRIDFADIFVILSRSSETYIKKPESNNQCTEVYLDSNLFEYSFFIACQMLLDAHLITKNTICFMLHDTCVAGPKFQSRVKVAALKYHKYDIIYGNSWGQHNIGLYNTNAISYGFLKYNHMEAINKGAAIAFEREGYLEYSPKSWPLKQYFPRYNSMHMGLSNPYEDNALRESNYMYFFDLMKYFYWGGRDGAGF